MAVTLGILGARLVAVAGTQVTRLFHVLWRLFFFEGELIKFYGTSVFYYRGQVLSSNRRAHCTIAR